jgi:hypothetical protein
MVSRRTFIGLCLAQLGVVAHGEPVKLGMLERGREFLVKLLDPALDLLPEYAGAKVYWLWHDNGFAAKMLSASNPEISRRIKAAIDREHVDRTDNKVELLFGESPNILPFRHYELKYVRRVGEKLIRTEIATDREMTGWSSYADLLLLASLAEKDPAAARRHWDAALAMWDGTGFLDPAARQDNRYATYKLGIALIAARRLAQRSDIPRGLVDRLQRLQADHGGWVTDYLRDGTPIGEANVETTCMAMLGLDHHFR